MIAALVLLLALALTVEAHEPPVSGPGPVPPSVLHAPTAMPDRVVLTWTGNPARSQAVTWRTDTSVSNALAQWAPATSKPQEGRHEVGAETQLLVTDLGAAHFHSAQMTNLEPGMVYAYRVGSVSNWSEWFQFRTASEDPEPFSFIYFGDAQNNLRSHWSRVFREAFRESPRAAFTLHAGDLVNQGLRDAEWGEWFGAPAWVNAMVPVIPAAGNHEYYTQKGSPAEVRVWNTRDLGTQVVIVRRQEQTNAAGKLESVELNIATLDGVQVKGRLDGEGRWASVDDGIRKVTGFEPGEVLGRALTNAPLMDRIAIPPQRKLTPHWRAQFALPVHGPPGLEETVYAVDYQGTRIIALNSNEQQEVQTGWLREVLTRNPQRWTIVTFHHPLFSPAKNRDNPALRRLWKPVFDEFRVDLVLTGHDHTYARSGDLRIGTAMVGTTNLAEGYQLAYDPEIGTVHVVSVSGPKMYAQGATDWAVRRGEDVQLFQVIRVDHRELRYEARTATGDLYDSFRLEKRAGKPNRLVEALPPESRRPPEKAK